MALWRWLNEIGRRMRMLFRREHFDREMDDEIRLHLELREKEHAENGRSGEEAYTMARKNFGNSLVAREVSHDAWGWTWLEQFAQDLRYGLRMLRKSPGFTAVAVLTLALGIGANTAIFSVVDAVLLKPLPFVRSGELVTLWQGTSSHTSDLNTASYPDFRDWQTHSRSFSSMAPYMETRYALTGAGDAVTVGSTTISYNLLPLLGVAPIMGTGFTPEDDVPGGRNGTNAVILSYATWRGKFGGDPQIVGREIRLDGKLYTIVGVMPRGFQFPIQVEPVDLWTTIAPMAVSRGPGGLPPTEQRGWHGWRVIARLKHGVSLAEARNELSSVQAGIARLYSHEDKTATVLAVNDAIAGNSRTALLILLAAVGCVLLIACTNVANLLLARAGSREHEIAVRAALGATSKRIVRQLLTENILLYSLGGILGLLLAKWWLILFVNLNADQIARITEAQLSGTVLGYTLAVTLLAAILFGLAPAFRTAKGGVIAAIKHGARAMGGGARQVRVRGLLVIGQTALTLVLLASAGLLTRSLARLQSVNPGFNPNRVMTFSVTTPPPRYATSAQSTQFFSALVERLSALPGVRSVSGIGFSPFGGSMSTDFLVRGQTSQQSNNQYCEFYSVEPDYFHTMEIPLLKGRFFTLADTETAPAVAIINESLASRYFPNRDPLGQAIQPSASTSSGLPPMRTIVGVVADVKADSLDQGNHAQVYMPYSQFAIGEMTMVLRTVRDPNEIINSARTVLHDLDSDLPFRNPAPLDEELSASLASPRYNMIILSAFSALALILTAIGLYGIISYSVVQRTQEMGIRIALGAQRKDVLALIMRQGAILVLIGTVLGLLGASAATRLLKSMLFDVSVVDPLTFAGAAIVLATAAFLACYIPARRAMKVDPMVALRYE